jgi:hypothetical protein
MKRTVALRSLAKQRMCARPKLQLLIIHIKSDEAVAGIMLDHFVLDRSPFIGLVDVAKALNVPDGDRSM